MNEEYMKKKEVAREKAKNIELYLEIHTSTRKDRRQIHDYLERLAKEAGLLKEFRENGYL